MSKQSTLSPADSKKDSNPVLLDLLTIRFQDLIFSESESPQK